MGPAYVLLGANLGDRLGYLSTAITLISTDADDILSLSSIYETEPWGVDNQPAYLNQVISLETALSPKGLLEKLLGIEKQLGRERHGKWQPREIDLDILYYGDAVITTSRLEIPHPRLHLRRFTLVPLNEIAPEFTHPVLGKTNRRLLKETGDRGRVQRLA